MRCCSVPCADTNRFFSRLAGIYRLRFRLFGFGTTQKQLLNGIREAGYENAVILDIGCGVGHLHRALVNQGAAKATGVDISESLIDEARSLSCASGMEAVTDYVTGDFVDIETSLDSADITILDKVVCCYPNAELLISSTLKKTRRVLALTYPRDRRTVRAGVSFVSMILKVMGSDFRPYVHDPEQIKHWITSAGFERASIENVFGWQTEIYVKTG